MTEPTHAPRGPYPKSIDDQARVVDAIASSAELSAQSLAKTIQISEGFCSFATSAFSVESLREVTESTAKSFVLAPSSEGEPSVATMHLRRSVLRLLFRTAREIGLADHDPTIDLVLPPRSSLQARPLTDEEIALCRAASRASLSATRLPAAWALAEASARSSELGHVRVRDVDISGRRVWLHGASKAEPRWAPMTEWGRTQLERRLAVQGDDHDRPVIYAGTRGSGYHRQAASCAAIGNVLRRAGLAIEADVRPLSVASWAGRGVLAESGRIDEVARRLGVRSLDRAAALIGWNWTDLEPTDA